MKHPPHTSPLTAYYFEQTQDWWSTDGATHKASSTPSSRCGVLFINRWTPSNHKTYFVHLYTSSLPTLLQMRACLINMFIIHHFIVNTLTHPSIEPPIGPPLRLSGFFHSNGGLYRGENGARMARVMVGIAIPPGSLPPHDAWTFFWDNCCVKLINIKII